MADPTYSHPDTQPLAESLGFGIRTRSLSDLFEYFRCHKQDTALASEIPAQLSARCYVCQSVQSFAIANQSDQINWRETLRCPSCDLINRWRSSVHLFEALAAPTSKSSIYITEVVTPLYRVLKQRYPKTIGSEFVAGLKSGETVVAHGEGIVVQDVTQLSFSSNGFDALLSFDVLEHVPDYRKALQEFFRVLKPGGLLLWSAPFCFAEQTEIRATLTGNGQIKHLMPPDYHGDPFAGEGVLCFQSFGMDILQEMEAVGFVEARVGGFSSLAFAYLGGNIAFLARKPRPLKKRWQDVLTLFSGNSCKSS